MAILPRSCIVHVCHVHERWMRPTRWGHMLICPLCDPPPCPHVISLTSFPALPHWCNAWTAWCDSGGRRAVGLPSGLCNLAVSPTQGGPSPAAGSALQTTTGRLPGVPGKPKPLAGPGPTSARLYLGGGRCVEFVADALSRQLPPENFQATIHGIRVQT
jgi:hypothetical protein